MGDSTPVGGVAYSVANSDAELATRFDEIFARLKEAVGARTDLELGTFLGLKQQTVAATKRRKQLPAIWITRASLAYGISSDWILYGTGLMKRGNAQIAPIEAQSGPRFIAEEDAPDHGLTMVPKVKARLTAGTGSLETSMEVKGLYAFRTNFLKRKGRPGKMVLMDVVGDSMEPDIWHGDTVLIDESQREVIAGGMFAVGIEHEVYLKYLHRIPGKLVLKSKNTEYDPIEVDMNGDLADTVKVIGRVVWSCREYTR